MNCGLRVMKRMVLFDGMGHNKDGQVVNYDKNHRLQRNDVSLPPLLSQSGCQMYALGSNRFDQLGVRRTKYENHVVEALVVTESSDTLMPFNFCRLTKIDGGTRFTIALTSQFDVYVAGIVESAGHEPNFTFLDASTIANRVVTASAHRFHVINTLTGRLFNLDLGGKCSRLVEQQADLNSCQILENPHCQVASYASGYRLILISTKKSSLNYFVMNWRNLVSHSTLSDVGFVFK